MALVGATSQEIKNERKRICYANYQIKIDFSPSRDWFILKA